MSEIGTDNCTARIPQLRVLRPATHDGEGEAGGEEVFARVGRPIETFYRRYNLHMLFTSENMEGSVCDEEL